MRDASGLTASTGRLLVPEDALKEISRLELIGENIAQPETETTIGLLISGRYRILPADTQFQREVNLVIDYSALVSTALAEKDLVGAVNVKGEWSKDPGAIVDPVTKTVTFSIQAMPAPAYAILVTKPAESKTDAIVGDKKLPTLTERLALGPDTDGDKLSDEEEVIYGVDARRPDTDTDGFLDGLEVMSLYNPRVAGNVTLADSGLVQRS